MNEKHMTDSKRRLIFMNLLVNCIASALLSTALTTALPPIIEDFGVSVSTGQWLTSGYSLAMGIMMPLTAFLITRFSTKKLYLTGAAVFILGLIICMLSTGFAVMMSGRILQALSGGLLTSMTQVIILSIYPAEQRGTAMGWYGLSIGAAPVIAPSLAGFLVDFFSWRIIFLLSAVIMGAAFVLAVFLFSDVLETSKKKFDFFSFFLSIFAFGGITLGLGNVSSYGITEPYPASAAPQRTFFRAANIEKKTVFPQRYRQHAPLSGHDGILRPHATVRSVGQRLFRHHVRSGRPSRIPRDGAHQSFCRQTLR